MKGTYYDGDKYDKQRIDILAKLKPRLRKFVLEYLKCGKASQAAIRAGYNSPSRGSVLLKKKIVKKAIKACVALECERFDVNEDSIVKAYKLIVNANVGDYITWSRLGVMTMTPKDQLTPEQLYAIESMKQTNNGIEFKLKDKLKALDALSKVLGMFKEKKEIDIRGSISSHLSCDYDITKLDSKELVKLRELLAKAKIVNEPDSD
jgi:phage terminase small subunit